MIWNIILYILIGLTFIFSAVLVYYTVKTLNMREELKGNQDPIAFMYVFNPLVNWGLKNEFPKNKKYTRLYGIYSRLKLAAVLVSAFLVLFLAASLFFRWM